MHAEDDPGDLHRPPEEGIPRIWRRAGIAAGVVAFLLMAGAIHVSTYEVAYGTRVYAQKTVPRGGRWALRVAVFDREASDFARSVTARAALVHPEAPPLKLGAGSARDTRAVDLHAHVPEELAPGPWTLEVHVETPAGEPETARFEVEVVEAADEPPGAWLAVRPACEEGSRAGPKGDLEPSARCRRDGAVGLYPESGELVSLLDNEVAVWAGPDAGKLAVAELPPRMSPTGPPPDPKEPPAAVAVNGVGLGWFEVAPTGPRGEIRVVTGERSADLWLREVPTQVLTRTGAPLRPPGGPLVTETEIVRAWRPLYLDTWAADRWIGAGSAVIAGDQALGYEVQLPDELTGFVAVRSYTHMSSPGAAYDDQLFFVHPDGGAAEALQALARAVDALPLAEPLAEYPPGERPGPDPFVRFLARTDLERLRALGSTARQRTAQVLVSRVVVTAPAAPLLGDTLPAKEAALEAWKGRTRRPILFGLVLLAAAVVLGAGWLVVSNRRAVRRRLAALEADEQAPADEETAPIGRAGLLVPALAILMLVGSAIAAVLLLLETLRWDWGG